VGPFSSCARQPSVTSRHLTCPELTDGDKGRIPPAALESRGNFAHPSPYAGQRTFALSGCKIAGLQSFLPAPASIGTHLSALTVGLLGRPTKRTSQEMYDTTQCNSAHAEDSSAE
jgi:hypothetical protein